MLTGVGLAAAQAPEGIRPAVLITTTPTTPPGPTRSPLVVIERVMSFDANKDLQLSRDELPERMQGIIARGDRNADGILDFEELRTLINAAAAERTRVAFRREPSEGLPGVVRDLKLSPEKHERALAIVNAHKPPPNVKEPSNDDLYKAMRSLLDDEEYENFVAATERLSKTVPVRMGIVDGIVGPSRR
jgi:hypothetical protein